MTESYWQSKYDTMRDERDAALAEVERMRKVVDWIDGAARGSNPHMSGGMRSFRLYVDVDGIPPCRKLSEAVIVKLDRSNKRQNNANANSTKWGTK